MSQLVEAPTKAFTADAAIALYARVKKTATGVDVAAAADQDIGVAEREAFAAGDIIPVRLVSSEGTTKMIAAGAVTDGAVVNTAAGGKVDDAAPVGSFQVGIALEAAGADGDIIEVLRTGHVKTAN